MSHHIKPCLVKEPDNIILHVGTNGIKDKDVEEIVDGIVHIKEIIKNESPSTRVAISELIIRTDKAENSQKIQKVNQLLLKVCHKHKWDLIEHKNIQEKHLNPYGLHLNKVWY